MKSHKILLFLFRLYNRGISPFLRPACRFFPTCSQYAYMATCQHGVRKGIWLTLKRLARCHPWGGYGIDYPPECQDMPKDIAIKAKAVENASTKSLMVEHSIVKNLAISKTFT